MIDTSSINAKQTMGRMVEALSLTFLNACMGEWDDASHELPVHLVQTSVFRQWRNERYCKKLLRKTEQISSLSQSESLNSKQIQRHKKRYTHLLCDVLGFSQGQTDLIMQPDCGTVTRSFIQDAKAFDPSLSPQDIYQASRNVWMMVALQMLLDKPVELTPAVFAYSLLYPYTDNFLDDPSIDRATKLRYFNVFKRKLEGETIAAENTHEEKLFTLVEMIESQHPRHSHPEVFESMLEIHRAQQQSIALLKKGVGLGEEEIRRAVFHKGGTSVLADGYLVAGKLGDKQAELCYFFGVILQLLDDLQDMEEDKGVGLKTVYSYAAKPEELAGLLNKTLHFVENIHQFKQAFSSDDASTVIDLIVKSCHFYMINNVSKYPWLYPEKYGQIMRSFTPVRMSVTNAKRKDLIYSYIASL